MASLDGTTISMVVAALKEEKAGWIGPLQRIRSEGATGSKLSAANWPVNCSSDSV